MRNRETRTVPKKVRQSSPAGTASASDLSLLSGGEHLSLRSLSFSVRWLCPSWPPASIYILCHSLLSGQPSSLFLFKTLITRKYFTVHFLLLLIYRRIYRRMLLIYRRITWESLVLFWHISSLKFRSNRYVSRSELGSTSWTWVLDTLDNG
ncbi:hypothetical protein HanRHA438_Chr13g0594771 [Helianthus annuus]|nr:hypothetical protein HanRHA438_Chr13g0594771 [Helianthus annuus]